MKTPTFISRPGIVRGRVAAYLTPKPAPTVDPKQAELEHGKKLLGWGCGCVAIPVIAALALSTEAGAVLGALAFAGAIIWTGFKIDRSRQQDAGTQARGYNPVRDYIAPQHVADDDAGRLQDLQRLLVDLTTTRTEEIDGIRLRVVVPELAWRLAQTLERIGSIEKRMGQMRQGGEVSEKVRERTRERVAERRAEVDAGISEIENLARALEEYANLEAIEDLGRMLEELEVDKSADPVYREAMESLDGVRQAARAVVALNVQWADTEIDD